MRILRPVLIVCLVPVVALAGCTGSSAPSVPPGLAFGEVRLPAAGAGRDVVQDVTSCEGRWYAAGATESGRAAAPAAWTSPDGRNWTAVPIVTHSAYGPQQTLTAVACRGAGLVAVGSAAGGAHGNLRTSTWSGGARGLSENPAGFELFGGPDQIGVDRLTAGPAGWLVGGARTDRNGKAGAAVWFSGDGRAFRLVDDDPQLESDARGRTVLTAVAADPSGGFAAVGSLAPPGSTAARLPLAWHSDDGRRWSRQIVQAVPQDAELQAVLADGPTLLAAGVLGNGFAVWRRAAASTRWLPVRRFGTTGGSGLPYVTGLAAGGGVLYCVVRDGQRHRLWRSASTGTGSWTEVALPAAVAGSGATSVRLVAAAGRILLATEDGTVSRLWLS